MVEPSMRTTNFKCPERGKAGFAAKMQGENFDRLSKGFHVSTRDGYVTVLCDCGARALPGRNPNPDTNR